MLVPQCTGGRTIVYLPSDHNIASSDLRSLFGLEVGISDLCKCKHVSVVAAVTGSDRGAVWRSAMLQRQIY